MTCAKAFVKCTIVTMTGERFVGTNDCLAPQAACPRLPGEGYEKCFSVCQQQGHAEINALRRGGDAAIGGHAYIEYHRICDDCREVLEQRGISYSLGAPPDEKV